MLTSLLHAVRQQAHIGSKSKMPLTWCHVVPVSAEAHVSLHELTGKHMPAILVLLGSRV